jgi:hypothetical protein
MIRYLAHSGYKPGVDEGACTGKKYYSDKHSFVMDGDFISSPGRY